ncbi:biosynthetic peptidoglycan transglycosylase [Peptostreptococcus faecalis]|uniref:biosynthetic peptidoglycan transglycosylase n=1 Tax=Peptostreptococcus faecalis TaxID=2045015 RepID=UPI000C7C5381|nr:biosynthetic peptidoglycan transglycosylase [Peptostreptococcus faecalis]
MSKEKDNNKIRRRNVSSDRIDNKSKENYNRNRNTRASKKNGIRIKKQDGCGSNFDEFNDTYDTNKRRTYDKKNRDNKIIRLNSNGGYEYEEYDDYDDEEYYTERKSHGLLKRVLKKLLIIGVIFTVVFGSIGFIYVKSVISDMPKVTKKMVLESYINKDPVELSKIPKNLQNAVIAIEDQRFYEHDGVDIRSLFRAVYATITTGKLQGGSTIDMQVSKNLLTSNEKSIKRKIKDMYNAIMMNKVMTKDEILEAYLNNIYLGKTSYGVDAGAELYFGKNVWELNFGQSTMLAGITNNPNLYQNYELAKKRQAVILYKMYSLGYIKENVYKAQLFRDTPFKSEIE